MMTTEPYDIIALYDVFQETKRTSEFRETTLTRLPMFWHVTSENHQLILSESTSCRCQQNPSPLSSQKCCLRSKTTQTRSQEVDRRNTHTLKWIKVDLPILIRKLSSSLTWLRAAMLVTYIFYQHRKLEMGSWPRATLQSTWPKNPIQTYGTVFFSL